MWQNEQALLRSQYPDVSITLDTVSPEARARIESAIAELGFVPNRFASGLRSKRTHTLALVLTDITNPFFTTIARGVEDTASEAGYTVIFCNTDESVAKEQMYLQMLLEKRVDGILLVPAVSGIASVKSNKETRNAYCSDRSATTRFTNGCGAVRL